MSGFERHPETQEALLGGFPLSGVFRHQQSPGPAYVYDLDGMEAGARALVQALAPSGLVAYTLKANSAGTILRRLARASVGADVVSGAELELALRGGIPAGKIVMSGVAKSDREIRDVGAYGFTPASEYNGRAWPAKIFISGGAVESVSPSPGT